MTLRKRNPQVDQVCQEFGLKKKVKIRVLYPGRSSTLVKIKIVLKANNKNALQITIPIHYVCYGSLKNLKIYFSAMFMIKVSMFSIKRIFLSNFSFQNSRKEVQQLYQFEIPFLNLALFWFEFEKIGTIKARKKGG